MMTAKTAKAVRKILNHIDQQDFTEDEIQGITFKTFCKYFLTTYTWVTTPYEVEVSLEEILRAATGWLNTEGWYDGCPYPERDKQRYECRNGKFYYCYEVSKKHYQIVNRL